MMTDNLHATEIRNERIDRTARMIARAAAAMPSLNAAAKADLRKAQEFLGRAVTAHMLGENLTVAEDANAAEVYARGAIVKSGYYDGYPADWADQLMADA